MYFLPGLQAPQVFQMEPFHTELMVHSDLQTSNRWKKSDLIEPHVSGFPNLPLFKCLLLGASFLNL